MVGLGIDTGGTCTDAVIYDSVKGEVLSTGKTLTTRHCLEEGIEAAIRMLDQKQLKEVAFVSLSTTLATNACVENRGGRVKLLFIGANRKVLNQVYKEYGFESLDDVLVIDGYPEGGYVDPVPPDWDALEQMMEEGVFEGAEAIGIVQMYPQRGNAFEEEAKRRLSGRYSVPVVCGSALFSDLNIIRRGAGTFLNVRLIPVIQAFLDSVKKVLSNLGISVPVYIVRSDGTLMNEAFALEHPVETLLCGPAASALGGAWMCEEKDALIVDIGGTTSDIAILRDDAAVTVDDGIKINGWKTFVKGMFIDTFGLGGDSAVHYEGKQVFLEDYRVIPVSMITAQYPELAERIGELAGRKYYFEKNPYEGFVLQREITPEEPATEWERSFCKALKEGPLLIEEARNVGDKFRFDQNVAPLEAAEIVKRFGLTPTDMMHIRGDFNGYHTQSAADAVKIMGKVSGLDSEKIPDLVYDAFVKKLTVNIQRILIERGGPVYREGIPDEIRKLLSHLYDNETEDLFHTDFCSHMPIIGVGGPSHIFMDRVAEKLHTRAILPKHAMVANAIGTLAGRVVVKQQLEIVYRSAMENPGYCFFLDGVRDSRDEFDDAVSIVEKHLLVKAEQIAKERGARGEITHKVNVEKKEDMFYSSLFLSGGTVTVTVYGSII